VSFTETDIFPRGPYKLSSASHEGSSTQMLSQKQSLQQLWSRRAKELKEAEHEVKRLEERQAQIRKLLIKKWEIYDEMKSNTRKQAYEHIVATTGNAATATEMPTGSKDMSIDIDIDVSSIEKKPSIPPIIDISNLSDNSSTVSKYRVSTPTRQFNISIVSEYEKEEELREAITRGIESLEKRDISMSLEDPAIKKRWDIVCRCMCVLAG